MGVENLPTLVLRVRAGPAHARRWPLLNVNGWEIVDSSHLDLFNNLSASGCILIFEKRKYIMQRSSRRERRANGAYYSLVL